MPELGPYGSVRGARGNSRPYRESDWPTVKMALLTLSGPRKPVVNFGWIGATTAFRYRFIDPIGVEFPCVITAAL
jgi:hypothetical protein